MSIEETIFIAATIVVVFTMGWLRGERAAKKYWLDVGRVQGRYRERWGHWADEKSPN